MCVYIIYIYIYIDIYRYIHVLIPSPKYSLLRNHVLDDWFSRTTQYWGPKTGARCLVPQRAKETKDPTRVNPHMKKARCDEWIFNGF